jgi:DNA polymerase-3 subunit delta'
MFKDPLPVELPNLLRIAPEGKAGLIRIGAIRGDDLVEGGVIQWAHRAPPPGCHRWILVEDAPSPERGQRQHAAEDPGGAARGDPFPPGHPPPRGHAPHHPLPAASASPSSPWGPMRPGPWPGARAGKRTAGSPGPPWPPGPLRYLEPRGLPAGLGPAGRLDHRFRRGIVQRRLRPPLLPAKDAESSQGEQVGQSLEILLLLLADVARCRDGKAPAAEAMGGGDRAAGGVGAGFGEATGKDLRGAAEPDPEPESGCAVAGDQPGSGGVT